MQRTLQALVLIIVTLLSGFVQAKTAAELQPDLIATWLVSVAGEPRARVLQINGVAQQKGEGAFQLDAVYGWADGNKTSVSAEIIETAQQLTLLITTQPGSKIATVQNQDGVFIGTFTAVNGQTKSVTIKRASEAELTVAVTPSIMLAGPGVPAACAALLGGWTGDWGFGKRILWVIEVTPPCTVRYAYSPKIRDFQQVEAKNGTLSFPCGSSGGTCHFIARSDELWGRYDGLDGSNNTVYKKIAVAK